MKIVARYGKDFGEDPHYFPHRINWDQEVTDPKTGKKLDLREYLRYRLYIVQSHEVDAVYVAFQLPDAF